MMNKVNFQTQTISLQGVINARELGGYIMPDGRRIKKGMLLRGATLHSASDEDISRLEQEFRLRTIVDFRMDVERLRQPNRKVDGADDFWLPAMDPKSTEEFNGFFTKGGFGSMEEIVLGASKDPQVRKAAHEFYTSMVDNAYTQDIYARFMKLLVNTDEGAFYWHCTQGKDRTGLGAAFILAALGADRRLILQDYHISQEFYKETFERIAMQLLQNGGDEEDLYVARTFIGANLHCFEDALDLIDRKYGSMKAYLMNRLGVSTQDMECLRQRYLEQDA